MEIENKKSLKKALEQPIDWGKYDKAAEPVIDIDLSLCTDEERPRMVAIVNRLAKSPAGRETLQIAADAGYKFGFLDAKTNCFGCCFGGMNCIGVAPWASDEKLVSTLCHESRHAGQGVRMEDIPDRNELNVASIIRASRAKEADAQAYALKACKELEMQGDAGPLQTFAEFYPPIYEAFEKSFAKEGVLNDRVVAATFKGWYDQTGTKQNYEEGYIIDPMHDAIDVFKQKKSKGVYTFGENVTSREIVKKIGWTKDGNYLAGENPKFLDEEQFLSIGERTKKDAQDFFALRKELTGQKPDKSVDKMPTHKDAFPRKLPEMGKPREKGAETMSMAGTIDKWNAVLAARFAQGR